MAQAFEKGAKIERIERNLVSPTVALRQIGAFMVAESTRAFREQQFGDRRWTDRRVPNIFGIIADFHAGRRAPPARRFEARPALQDTGRLAASMASQLVGTDVVEVGTTIGYASVHHRGGRVESETITDTVRTALWSWLRTRSREIRQRLGWLLSPNFRGKKLTANVPARPMVGITRRTREAIRKIIGVEIMEAR